VNNGRSLVSVKGPGACHEEVVVLVTLMVSSSQIRHLVADKLGRLSSKVTLPLGPFRLHAERPRPGQIIRKEAHAA
jgi:hypothetical protein